MIRSRAHAAALAVLFALTACGGGGGGSSPVAPGSGIGAAPPPAPAPGPAPAPAPAPLNLATQQVDAGDPTALFSFSENPSMVAVPGGYAVGWRTLTQECVRRYTSEGKSSDASCLDTPGAPKLAALQNGDVVALVGFTARIEHPDGTWSAAISVIANTDGAINSDVTGLKDSTWVVAWLWHQSTATGYEYQVRMRHFAADGTPLTGELAVSEVRSAIGDIGIGALLDGSYVVAWTNNPPADNVTAQRFAADATPIGGVITVGSPAHWAINPVRIAGLAGGGFAVLWRGERAPRVRVFGGDGTPVGDAFDVDTPPDTPFFCGYTPLAAYCRTEYRAQSVAPLAEGGFVVAYTVEGVYTQLPYARARRFDANGTPLAASVDVTATEPLARPATYAPVFAGLPNDTFALAWQYDSGQPMTGIYFHLYAPDALK